MSSDAFPRQQGEETEEWVSQEVKIEAKKDRFREPQPVVAWWFVSESIAVT